MLCEDGGVGERTFGVEDVVFTCRTFEIKSLGTMAVIKFK